MPIKKTKHVSLENGPGDFLQRCIMFLGFRSAQPYITVYYYICTAFTYSKSVSKENNHV